MVGIDDTDAGSDAMEGTAGTINTYTHNVTDRCEACPYRATLHPIRATAGKRR